MSEIYAWVVLAGLGLALAATVALVWLRSRLSITQYGQLLSYIEQAVAAAEQLCASGQLAKDERFAWAMEQIQARFPHVHERDLIMLIESAVWGLKTSTTWLQQNESVVLDHESR